jgi:hypothetical protein
MSVLQRGIAENGHRPIVIYWGLRPKITPYGVAGLDLGMTKAGALRLV